MKIMKKTVGLILITNTGKAVLQVRGNFNIERNEPETYADATQLTVHGSIEKNESEIDALLRETREELGKEFANLVQGKALELREINRVENEEISVVNFGLSIAEKDLEKIKGAKMRPISKNEIANIRELKPSDREKSIDKNEIAMFPDDIEAVKLAFEKLT